MKISLRQTGGIVGIDDSVHLENAKLSASSAGEAPRSRRLSPAEAAKVREAAERLLAKDPPKRRKDAAVASDSMLTEVSIGGARRERIFRVESGDDAPSELWDLVDALTDAARPR